jgi:serine O-acetyltransferase
LLESSEESSVNPIEQRESGSFRRTNDTRSASRSLARRLLSKVSALNAGTAPVSELVRFVELAREDLDAHDGDWTRPGFQALLVHRFGTWRMSIRSRLLRAPFSVCSRALFAAIRNFYGIELPFSARIGRRVIFEHQHGIVVHGNCVIGDDCIIRQGVTLGIRRMDRLTEAPVLGRGVNVGAGAKVLGRVFVGDHADIGANAVVLEDVPAHTLAIGIPAHNISRAVAKAPRRELTGRLAELPAAPRSSPANSNGAAASLSDGSNGAPPASSKANRASPNGAASSRTGAASARAN